jgi:cyanophycinase
VIYDARDARITGASADLGAAGVRLHVLPAGSTFDPRTGVATVPGG